MQPELPLSDDEDEVGMFPLPSKDRIKRSAGSHLATILTMRRDRQLVETSCAAMYRCASLRITAHPLSTSRSRPGTLREVFRLLRDHSRIPTRFDASVGDRERLLSDSDGVGSATVATQLAQAGSSFGCLQADRDVLKCIRSPLSENVARDCAEAAKLGRHNRAGGLLNVGIISRAAMRIWPHLSARAFFWKSSEPAADDFRTPS